MDLKVLFEQYWLIMALGLWFAYKWWNASRVMTELSKSAPAVLCCASGTRSGMAKMVLKKNGYPWVYKVGTWRKFLP